MAHECQNLMKNVFIQKEKKKYHGPWMPNLILSYQALHKTKYWFFLDRHYCWFFLVFLQAKADIIHKSKYL